MKKQSYDMGRSARAPKFALAQLTYDEFLTFWPHIEKMLDQVPHTWTHWTKEYILAAAEMGRLVVWGIGPPPDAVCIFFTTVHTYPTGNVLCIDWSAGHFDDGMVPLLDAAWTTFAQAQGCVSIEIRGRGGWEKHLRPIGFVREAIVWSRQVPKWSLQ